MKVKSSDYKPLGGGKYLKWDDHYNYFVLSEQGDDQYDTPMVLTISEMANLVAWQVVILAELEGESGK